MKSPHPSQISLGKADYLPANQLADLVAALMYDNGLNPREASGRQELVDRMELAWTQSTHSPTNQLSAPPSLRTIENILNGKRGKYLLWGNTVEWLVVTLCGQDRPGTANLLRALANRQATTTGGPPVK